jgi:hypothetical protein
VEGGSQDDDERQRQRRRVVAARMGDYQLTADGQGDEAGEDDR